MLKHFAMNYLSLILKRDMKNLQTKIIVEFTATKIFSVDKKTTNTLSTLYRLENVIARIGRIVQSFQQDNISIYAFVNITIQDIENLVLFRNLKTRNFSIFYPYF